MPDLLKPDEIDQKLHEHPNWELDGKTILRELKCKDFRSALAVLNAIGAEAEAMDHHPDLLLHQWNRLRISVSTHSAGGLTELDFRLASAVDTLAAESEEC